MKQTRFVFLMATFVLMMAWLVPAQDASQTRFFKSGIPGEKDGKVDLIFRIYDQEMGGTQVFEEMQTVQLSQGLFRVNLGQGTPNGLPAEVLQPKAPFWVEFSKASAPNIPVSQRTPLNPIETTGFGGVCKLCATCGGGWPFFSGSFPTAVYRELGLQCSGDFVEVTDNAYLCCQ